MILTSLIAVAFGAFGTGANGNNVYYDNTITMSSGLVSICTLKGSSTYATMDVKYDVSANCDFREVTNDQGNTEYWVHFNSWEADLKSYDPTTDTFSTITHSTTYFNNFESSVVDDPNNTFEISFYLNQSSNTATLSAYCEWYDITLDEASGINVSASQPIMNSTLCAPFPNTYKVTLDRDDLRSRLELAFNMARGGWNAGYDQGYADGTENGKTIGYQTGYADGYTEGVSIDSTAFTIFNGILNIGMIPINFFLAMFDFTILGINISNFVMSVLSVFVTIWLIRMLTGKKTDGN